MVGEHMCVYLRMVVTIGSDKAVSSPALQRAWVEEPANMDITRLAVKAAPSQIQYQLLLNLSTYVNKNTLNLVLPCRKDQTDQV